LPSLYLTILIHPVVITLILIPRGSLRYRSSPSFPFFFFNDTATTEIYTLSLHDALPISPGRSRRTCRAHLPCPAASTPSKLSARDRKSTRLNSSHVEISYAVFCLKKKKNNIYDVRLLATI